MSVINYLLTKDQVYQGLGLVVIKYLHKNAFIKDIDIELNSSINKELHLQEQDISALCKHLSDLYKSQIEASAIVDNITFRELLDQLYNSLENQKP